ncbi:MAG: precorrin-3B C(17)-methyltransferase [Desulfovibrio sp.]|nr:precorrin-3B C(17)-methyltransferase [Desulfovibrio sp.]
MSQNKNTLFVLGLGPGDPLYLTPKAHQILTMCSTIVGYPLYLDLLPKELCSEKKIIATGMRKEEERCQKAIQACLAGQKTALICSGDAGIYALAGLVLEILDAANLFTKISLEIIPGVPALCAAAALLGAPLTHDFACISLSDLLTPKDLIIRRLHAAFVGDFVTVLYNPRSQGRTTHLGEALALAAQYKDPQTPVGIVRNAFRSGQSVAIFPLNNVPQSTVDMLSIVIIGNSQSRLAGPYMLTPRGYQLTQNKEYL